MDRPTFPSSALQCQDARAGVARDPLPALDVPNGFLTLGLQVALCLIAFCGMFGRAREAVLAALAAAALGAVLYFTWYRVPPRGGGAACSSAAAGLR